MISASPHQYLRRGLDLGVRRETLEAALAQASAVEDRGLPAILSLGHLAASTHTNVKYLRRIVERKIDPYRSFAVAKRGQKAKRYISIPELRLMTVQRWLLRQVFNKAQSHPRSYAYEQGRSIKQCAQKHCGARWLLKVDLHDFFHSINEKQIYGELRALGYQPLVAFEISRIVTRKVGHTMRPSLIRAGSYLIGDYHSERLGFLPQGAPTSGKLANLVASTLDEKLCATSDNFGVEYTRYADDLTFSSSSTFNRGRSVELLREICKVARDSNFEVHHKKTRIVPPGARKIVLGLLVDSDEPRLPRFTRQRLESHVRGVEKFGVRNHAETRGFSSTWGFIAHVGGLISFTSDIDSSWTSHLDVRWKDALSRDGWLESDLRSGLYFPDSYGLPG